MELREAPSESDGCFYKVLPDMRRANSTDYDPIFFTFGPYHANLADTWSLSSCNSHKKCIARALTNSGSFKELLKKIINRPDGHGIQKIYGKRRAYNTPVLPYLLAVDALTVVAAAGRDTIKGLSPETLLPVIRRDAMLLEQQLPLFILQAAIDSINSTASQKGDNSSTQRTLEDVVSFYVKETSYPFQRNKEIWSWREPQDDENSMLSHIHSTFLNPEAGKNMVTDEFPRLPSASKLNRWGIQFKVGNGGFTGISFHEGKRELTLPEITVFGTTKAYLLNLVAHEAAISASSDQPSPVTSYILLMDFLIDTEEDVSLLVEKEVIRNHLGSDKQLADMWNTLTDHLPICFTERDFKTIQDVRDASSHRLNKCWAGFHDTYCEKKPWLVISIIAAFLLLLAGLTQAIFSILQYIFKAH